MQTLQYCTLYVVRHGQTEFNVKQVMQGQGDSPLTELGVKQAGDLGQVFKDLKFDAIFSSDLLRAQRTAEIAKLDRQLVVNTHKLLRERSFGNLDGTPVEKFQEMHRELYAQRELLSEKEKTKFKFYDGYESDDEIASRMILALREISLAYLGKTVLVVSHGAIMRALLLHLGFGTYDELVQGKTIGNTGYIKLESDGVDFFIRETKGVNKSS